MCAKKTTKGEHWVRKKDNKVSGLFVYNSKKGKLDDRIKELKKLLRVDLQEIIQIKSFKV